MARQQSPETPPSGEEDIVYVQVCLECGKEYTFEGEKPPGDLVCDKCGNEVFRSFYDTSGERGEADQDFHDETDRSVDNLTGGEGVTPSDLLDLNNP